MIQILNVVIRKGKNPHSYGSKQAGHTPGGTCFDPRYFYILGKVTRKNPGDLVKHLLCQPDGYIVIVKVGQNKPHRRIFHSMR